MWSVSFNKSLNYRGYDMNSQAQSAAFMPALTNKKFELVQPPQLNGSFKILFQYVGVARIDKPGIVQIGYRPERIMEAQHLADIKQIETDTRIGTNGSLYITENTGFPADYKKVFRTSNSLLLSVVSGKYLLTAELPDDCSGDLPEELSLLPHLVKIITAKSTTARVHKCLSIFKFSFSGYLFFPNWSL